MLKKYRTVIYKITLLAILFPASVKKNIKQIFVTGKELSGVKKSTLNRTVYDLIAIINLDKISNWKDIKGQSIWISASFKDQKEMNNDIHLCFPFWQDH